MTSYFDWIGTPHHALVQLINNDLKGAFQRKNLVISENGETVLDSAYGTSYKHYFAKLHGELLIDPASIDTNFHEGARRLSELARRWHALSQVPDVIYVRKDVFAARQIDELLSALEMTRRNLRFWLMIAAIDGSHLQHADSRVVIKSGCCIPSTPREWKGDDSWWEEAFGCVLKMARSPQS